MIGKDIEKRGKCLVKWEDVCKAKAAGGLGVLNLRTQCSALLMKHLYKFINQQDIPWVQLIWNAYYRPNLTLHNWFFLVEGMYVPMGHILEHF